MSQSIEELKKELAVLQAQLAAKQGQKSKAKIKNGERHIPMGSSGKSLKSATDIPPQELQALYRKKIANLANQALMYETQAAKFQKMADLCYAQAHELQARLT